MKHPKLLFDKIFLLFIVALSASSFLYHYLWENVQCRIFFIHTKLELTQQVMIFATLGDVCVTWLVQMLIAIMTQRWYWSLTKWNKKIWLLQIVLAVSLGIGVERYALITYRWHYTKINPLIPGTPISAIPILQLLLLLPASFITTKFLLKKLTT